MGILSLIVSVAIDVFFIDIGFEFFRGGQSDFPVSWGIVMLIGLFLLSLITMYFYGLLFSKKVLPFVWIPPLTCFVLGALIALIV